MKEVAGIGIYFLDFLFNWDKNIWASALLIVLPSCHALNKRWVPGRNLTGLTPMLIIHSLLSSTCPFLEGPTVIYESAAE